MSASSHAAREQELERALKYVTKVARGFRASVMATPVRPRSTPEELEAALPLALGEVGLTLEEVVRDLGEILEATPATTSPGFFNQLFGGTDPAALIADMLVPLLNNSMYTWKVAGPHVLIEQLLVERMMGMAGMPPGEGIFTPGGSVSNLTAMLLARDRAVPDARDEGVRGAPLRVYTSIDAHYSVSKAAGILGIGRGNVVSIPTDDDGRMLVDALDAAIAADKAAGHRPLFISATAGTTVQGAFDPIGAIADVAASHAIWLHVDGALGASMLLSPRHRHLLDGVERADSLAWNAHKMMGVPLACCALLVARPGSLGRSLSSAATYLFEEGSNVYDPGTRSIQCGRRNDMLKLWTAWKFHGDQGYAARIDHLVALAAHAVKVIEADPTLGLLHRPQSANVCFEVRGKSSEAICANLHADGAAMVGYGDLFGRRSIRLALVDATMQTTDLDAFFASVRAVAAELPDAV